jgi:hypothetical protein
MKFTCKCGQLVVDSPANQKYRWTRQVDWERLLDAVDSEIERIEGEEGKENAIMAIRYCEKSTPVWTCPQCGRLITLKESSVIYLRIESD